MSSEGQQSKLADQLRQDAQRIRDRGGPPRGAEAVAIIVESCARLTEDGWAAEVARVRADVAEDIARDLERIADSEQAPMAYQYRHAMRTAARRARAHAGKGFPGSVETRTPISAPSDVDAPRDALTDQDFADLRADARSARDDGAGLERAARALRAKLGTVDAFEDPVKAAAERQVARDLAKIAIDAYRGLPEDEGTRQEV